MKKNLRNVLALALGLITTVSFAQDWNVDSRTRIDMSDAADDGSEKMMTDQRVTLGATWGGSNWGIHVSSDVNYNLGDPATSYTGTRPTMSIYEAHASADLFGMASMTVGRQALDYGSGALISSNQWGANRTTWDGFTFGLGLSDMADITIGYASRNDSGVVNGVAPDANANMYANIGGEFSGWNVNILYMTKSGPDYDAAGMSDNAAMGIDISGALMGATLSLSMNTDHSENEMRVLSLGYSVNDDLSVNVGQTAYSTDNVGTFMMPGTDMSGGWANGNLGYLASGMEDLHYGVSYNLGGISLGATMHNITDATEGNDDYERSVMVLDLGYSMSNNASLGLKYATDDNGSDDSEANYTWLTLTVTP